MTKLTLKQIRKHNLNKDSWLELLKHFDKTEADETEVSFQQLIDILGFEYAVWCLRCLPENRKDDIINFAADCAESVLHGFESQYPEDNRPRKVIEAARNYKNLTKEQFAEIYDAAYDSYNDTCNDVYDAVYGFVNATYEAEAHAVYYDAYDAHAAAYAAVNAANTVNATYDTHAGYYTDEIHVNQREKQTRFLLKYFGD